MSFWQRPPAHSLLAGHLRAEIARGRWQGRMPGVIRLARELGAARNTVERALQELEHDGILRAQGHGRGRIIDPENVGSRSTGLRVGILPYEESDKGLSYIADIRMRLEEAGHQGFFAQDTLLDLQRDVARVVDFIGGTEADAWIFMGAPRELLEEFARRPVPVFALFGRRRGVPVAGGGPDKAPAIREVVRRLRALGHRRIVLFSRLERRKPQPGATERAFLEEMEATGISTGPYHLPDWHETPEGFVDSLNRIFERTPPTALIFDESRLFAAAQHHLARKGLLAPRDLSLVCCDPPESNLSWIRPRPAHIRWDPAPLVRRVVRWADNLSHARKDLRQSSFAAEFVEGGTIGPVKPA